MRGLHGKRPGVQVERTPEGACGGPCPSRGAVPGSWPGGPGATGAEEQVKALQMQSLSERVHYVQPRPADWFCEVTTAQCTDCQCKEIWPSVGKRQERL